MIRRLIALALSLCLVGGSAEAAGFGKLLRIKHGLGSAPSIPSVLPGAGWSGFTAQPAKQGNPGDYGYSEQAVARVDQVPYQTLNAGDQMVLSVVGDALSGIAFVDFQVEGGSAVRVTSQSVNPQTGSTGYNIAINANDFSTDKQQELRATICPNAGDCLVMQGATASVPYHIGTVIAGTLTIDLPGSASVVSVGQGVFCPDCASGTRITAGSGTTWTVTPTQDANGGTGDVTSGSNVITNIVDMSKFPVGGIVQAPGIIGGTIASVNAGAHTATLGSSQTAASTQTGLVFSEFITVGEAPGFFISTNKGASLPTTARYASATGTDGAGCGATVGSPCLTWSGAITSIGLAQSGDFGGGVVCSAAGNFSYGNATENTPRAAATRWPIIQPDNLSPCVGGSGGTVAMITNGSTAGMRIAKMRLKNIQINGVLPVSTSTAVGDPTIWFDHVAYTGQGLTVPNFYGPFKGGVYWTDSTVLSTQNGAIAAILDRNVTVDTLAQDAFSNTRTLINSTTQNMTNFLATGDIASGSADVANVTDTSKMTLNGYIAAGATGFPVGTQISCLTACTGGAGHITVSKNATLTQTGIQLLAGSGATSANAHGDMMQITGFIANQVISGLTATNNNTAQGYFTDGSSDAKGVVVLNSTWASAGGVFTVAQVNQLMQNITWRNNTWSGNMVIRPVIATNWLVFSNVCGTAMGTVAGITYTSSPTCQ